MIFSLFKFLFSIFLIFIVLGFVVLKTINLVPTEENYDKNNKEILSIPIDKHYRAEEQTYLTYPEWFLVFSPKEYAQFLQEKPSHEFPFIEHIKQFWSSYDKIKAETEKFPYNEEYHTMIKVIGYSTTIEYGIKTFYEKIFGAFSWLFVDELTPEDLIIAKYQQEYVDFIENEPWYKFDFASKISSIWNVEEENTKMLAYIRSFERKISFTLEFFAKAVYGRIIGLATSSSFDKPIFYTLVEIDKDINIEKYNKDFNQNILKIKDVDNEKRNLYLFPRYQPFTTSIENLISYNNNDFNILSIAGQNKDILISVISNEKDMDEFLTYYNLHFIDRLPIITNENKYRYLIKIPIINFNKNIENFVNNNDFYLEHIFDF